MKTVLVTGGTRGIGLSTALKFKEDGWNVYITSRKQENLDAVLEDHSNLKGFVARADDLSAATETCESIVSDTGSLDVLINNAGTGFRRDVEQLNIDDFLHVYNTNVFGLSILTKEIIPNMKKQKKGTIINIGSTASLKGYKGGSIYASSKFAVRALTQCWQAELRPYNIRVCQINPSEVPTAFANKERIERKNIENKLTTKEIAHAITSAIEMDDRGFINELNVWATNPFN